MFKKTWVGLFVLMIFCFGFSSPLRVEDENLPQKTSVPKSFLCWEELLSHFNGNVHIEKEAIAIEDQTFCLPSKSTLPSATSVSGFDQAIIINGVSYFAKYLNNTLIKSNAGPIEDVKFVISIASGETQSTSTSVTTCGTYKISVGVQLINIILQKFGITAGLDYTYSKCKTVTKGTIYTFPSNCAGFNSASFYIGTAYDLYKYTYDIAPLISARIERMQCIRGCRFTKDPAVQEACIAQCNNEYSDYPDLSSISRYEVNVYIPRPISWSVCSNGPG